MIEPKSTHSIPRHYFIHRFTGLFKFIAPIFNDGLFRNRQNSIHNITDPIVVGQVISRIINVNIIEGEFPVFTRGEC